MKRIAVTLLILATAFAFGYWRDTYVDPDSFDYLSFVVGGVAGLLIAFIWADPAIRGLNGLMDWMDR